MTFFEVKDIFELMAYIVTVFGFPIAIYIFYLEREKERSEARKQALVQASDRYVEFLTLSLNYPRLDIFTTPIAEKYQLTAEDIRIESSLLSMIIDMFGKTYLLYHVQQECIEQSQWDGWVDTIRSYCFRENFKREWEVIGSQYDNDFYLFMQNLMSDETP